jgi:hypothetical protein
VPAFDKLARVSKTIFLSQMQQQTHHWAVPGADSFDKKKSFACNGTKGLETITTLTKLTFR